MEPLLSGTTTKRPTMTMAVAPRPLPLPRLAINVSILSYVDGEGCIEVLSHTTQEASVAAALSVVHIHPEHVGPFSCGVGLVRRMARPNATGGVEVLFLALNRGSLANRVLRAGSEGMTWLLQCGRINLGRPPVRTFDDRSPAARMDGIMIQRWIRGFYGGDRKRASSLIRIGGPLLLSWAGRFGRPKDNRQRC